MLPLAAPLLIGGIQASTALMAGEEFGAVSHWLNLLAAFDAVFLVVGWMAFEYVVAGVTMPARAGSVNLTDRLLPPTVIATMLAALYLVFVEGPDR
jgi:hypothetical protein